MLVPPALLLNGVLAVAAKAAQSRRGAARAADSGNNWLDIASELATVMFAHEANDQIRRARQRIADRFGGIRAPENVALERALAKSAAIAGALCLMEASPGL